MMCKKHDHDILGEECAVCKEEEQRTLVFKTDGKECLIGTMSEEDCPKVDNGSAVIICSGRSDELPPVTAAGEMVPLPFIIIDDLTDEEKVKRVDAIKEMMYENDHGLGTSACEFDHFLGILIDGDYDDE